MSDPTNDGRYQRIGDVARYVLGCHPAYLYREIVRHPEAWKRHIIERDGVTYLNAVAIADAHAALPEALAFPKTRPNWKRRGGKKKP
ncbi:hypothetical protein [Streptomyces sp. V4I2]|uniref:hypothetical protein n=1 Tax=Streptomyces sp. V4I2 TaxID=3042280 RepID=UPI002782F877|nr:hypothetical protein [Streptomyces sp. V4I2]MDQ1044308.1 hypothetical protein [Streptomyces sp. V4I2]